MVMSIRCDPQVEGRSEFQELQLLSGRRSDAQNNSLGSFSPTEDPSQHISAVTGPRPSAAPANQSLLNPMHDLRHQLPRPSLLRRIHAQDHQAAEGWAEFTDRLR